MIFVKIHRMINRSEKKFFFDEKDISYVDDKEIILKNGKSISLSYGMNCILDILEGKTENKVITQDDFGTRIFKGSLDDAKLFFKGSY